MTLVNSKTAWDEMKVIKSCKYCNFINNAGSDLHNTIIAETDSFIVVPTLGSLVPGWQLVIPKEHCLNALQLNFDKKEELNNLLQHRIELTKNIFKQQVLIFEHGAISDNTAIGCGIDHAHIHIVPFEMDILNEIKQKEPTFRKLDIKSIYDFYLHKNKEQGKPYWVFSSDQNAVYYTDEMQESSQFFRKIIAKHCGMSERFDYKKFKFEINTVKTLELFSVNNTKNVS